jgi:hypothetical protein
MVVKDGQVVGYGERHGFNIVGTKLVNFVGLGIRIEGDIGYCEDYSEKGFVLVGNSLPRMVLTDGSIVGAGERKYWECGVKIFEKKT